MTTKHISFEDFCKKYFDKELTPMQQLIIVMLEKYEEGERVVLSWPRRQGKMTVKKEMTKAYIKWKEENEI